MLCTQIRSDFFLFVGYVEMAVINVPHHNFRMQHIFLYFLLQFNMSRYLVSKVSFVHLSCTVESNYLVVHFKCFVHVCAYTAKINRINAVMIGKAFILRGLFLILYWTTWYFGAMLGCTAKRAWDQFLNIMCKSFRL